ncbi:MAG: class B sortase [Clostridia bacterium]|nr:class B sortase [Clostridia bacterium]
MKSSNEPNFYLKHDFNKNYTDYGYPYVQKNCDLNTSSENIIIYGHNMKDGSMFSELENYKTKSYWESHKTIRFDTLTSQNEYEVCSSQVKL